MKSCVLHPPGGLLERHDALSPVHGPDAAGLVRRIDQVAQHGGRAVGNAHHRVVQPQVACVRVHYVQNTALRHQGDHVVVHRGGREYRRPGVVGPAHVPRQRVEGVEQRVARPDVDHAVVNGGRRKDVVVRLVHPQLLAAVAVQRVELAVAQPVVHDPAGHRGRGVDRPGGLAFPDQVAGRLVQRDDPPVAGGQVQHAVHHRRRRKQRPVRVESPLEVALRHGVVIRHQPGVQMVPLEHRPVARRRGRRYVGRRRTLEAGSSDVNDSDPRH